MKKFVFLNVLLFITFAIIINYSKKDLEFAKKSDKTLSEKKELKLTRKIGFNKWRQEMLVNVETGKVEKSDYYNTLNEVNLMSSSISSKTNNQALTWESRGPDSQGGRTRTMLFDKDDEKLIFTGSVSGGLFKSINGGYSWERISSFFLNNPAIMSITQSINGTIYVGTGESLGNVPDGDPFSPETTGSGIYKSTNLGNSWTSVDETNEYLYPTNQGVWSSTTYLANHPTNTNTLFAGTKGGLKISLNAEDTQPTFNSINGVPTNTIVSDIKITANGTDGWCAADGKIYKSTGDITNSFWNEKGPTITSPNPNRAQIALSTLDNSGNYIIYASFTGGASDCLIGVYKSEDKGNNWSQIIYPGGLDPFDQPTGGDCQGRYDHCLAVSPVDKNKIYIGGITFYTWGAGTGGMKRADKIGSEGGNHLDSDYLHADKHGIFFNPHDISGNTMYIVGDGGIFRTNNALTGFPDEMIYSEHNKNYITLQGYSIGTGKHGEVITGCQDNGTQYVDYKGISPKAAKMVSGGDGIAGAEISNLCPNILFSGSYYGRLYRTTDYGDNYGNFLSALLDKGGCGRITCTTTDNTITCDDIAEEGQGFVYPFLLMETHNRLNPRYDAYITARNEIIALPGGGVASVKDTIYAGEVINHEQFTMPKMPKFDKEGLGLSFILEQDLYPGKKDSFENKFDAKYFVPTKCGDFFVCTNPLQQGVAPIFSSISLPTQSGIKNMDYSSDGDLVAAVSGSNLIVMQGWDAYDPVTNPNSVTYEFIPIGVSKLSGVSVDKNDKNRIMITQYGYGGGNKMFMITNATYKSTDSISPVLTPIQGDLPKMPVYSCVIDKDDNQRYIIGTELGIFATLDGGVTWTPENTGLGARMPVYSVRQEWMNNFDCQVLSATALGGGMFTSSSYTDCDLRFGSPPPTTVKDLEIENNEIVIFPNPAKDIINIAFETTKEFETEVQIIDITGKIITTQKFGKLAIGKQNIRLNVSELSTGNYLIRLINGFTIYRTKHLLKE